MRRTCITNLISKHRQSTFRKQKRCCGYPGSQGKLYVRFSIQRIVVISMSSPLHRTHSILTYIFVCTLSLSFPSIDSIIGVFWEGEHVNIRSLWESFLFEKSCDCQNGISIVADFAIRLFFCVYFPYKQMKLGRKFFDYPHFGKVSDSTNRKNFVESNKK